MRKWPVVLPAVLAAVALGTAVPVWAATAVTRSVRPQVARPADIAGYDMSALAAAVRYQLNSPGLLPVGDPSEGNIMEADLPFARISASQGPVVDALASPAYGGDTLAHLGTALVTFGAPPSFSAANYPILAEANYPPSPGHGATASFGSPAGSDGSVKLGPAAADSTANADTSTAAGELASIAVPASSPLVSVAASSASTKVTLGNNQVLSQAESHTGAITIAGIITIGGIDATASATSDGTTAKPTAALAIGKVTVAGQPAYIDGQGVHLASQAVGSGVAPAVQSLLQKTLDQDGINIRLVDPQTSTKDGLATGDAGGLSIVLDRTVPALGVPGVPGVNIPGVGFEALGTPDLPLHVELTLGMARVSTNATGVPAFDSSGGGDAGSTGAVEGEQQTSSDLSAGGAGASVSGAADLGTVPTGGGGLPSTSLNSTPAALATASPPLGPGVPLGGIIVGILACIVLMGPLLGYARWQLLEGRSR